MSYSGMNYAKREDSTGQGNETGQENGIEWEKNGKDAPEDFLCIFYQSDRVPVKGVKSHAASFAPPKASAAPKEGDGIKKAGDKVKEPGKLGFRAHYSMKIKEASSDLKGEGDGGEKLTDVFYVDTEEYLSVKRRRLAKRTVAALLLLIVVIPLTLAAWFFFMGEDKTAAGKFLDDIFGSRKYYVLSLFFVVYALVPFFMVFEGRKPKVRELIILASLVALAVAGRAAFFMLPHFKPMVAIVIISGIAFGGEAGFLVGAVTMFVSNFLFGQGPWTPWQMFACGSIGFLSGVLNRLGLLPARRRSLCIYGFLVTVFIYGGIMNPAALFMSTYKFTWIGLLAIYISGIPVDLVHAASTFLFLWIGAKPLLEKLQRVKVKYGLL